jgi:predicted  nucleic acid-binding Zn-ribbon protein
MSATLHFDSQSKQVSYDDLRDLGPDVNAIVDMWEQGKSVDANYDSFQESIQSVRDRAPPLLDDFQTNYVYAKSHPENQEYGNSVAINRNQLQQLKQELQTIENNIQTHMQSQSDLTERIQEFLSKANGVNQSVKETLAFAQAQGYGYRTRLQDYQQENHDALVRWYLLLCSNIALLAAVSFVLTN